MGRWDRDFKVVARLRPQDLLGLVPGVVAPGRVRALDKELASVPLTVRAVDAFIEVASAAGSRKQYFQLEAEVVPRGDTGKRVFAHWSLAYLVLGERTIRPVVFYLFEGADRRRPATSYLRRLGGGSFVRFTFEIICLWEQPADALLARDAPGLWPLVPLCGDADRSRIERACRQLEALRDDHLSSELLGVWHDIAGTRLGSEDLWAMVRRKEQVMESSTYKATLMKGRKLGKEEGIREGIEQGKREGIEQGIREGIEEGKREGIEQGKREGIEEGKREGIEKGLRRACLGILRSKLGAVPPEAGVLSEIRNPARLQEITEALSMAVEPQALLDILRDLAGEEER